MAKKKAAKKQTKPKSVTLRFISDPGHGWLEVPHSLCKTLGLGTDFPTRGGFCYLEEDAECTDFERAAKRHGVSFATPEHDVDNFDYWLNGDQWPYIPAAVYGDDRTLVCSALESMGNEMKQCHLDDTYSPTERKDFRKLWEDCVRLTGKFATLNGVGGD
jgi:hypothetical protein